MVNFQYNKEVKEDIISKLPLGGNEIVFLSGTLIEGIGNAHSDYDVYVVSDNKPARDENAKHNHIKFNGNNLNHFYDYLTDDGLAFDVEFWTFDEIEEAASQVKEFYKESLLKTKTHRKTLPDIVEDFVHKLFIAVPLLGDDRLSEIQKKFDKNEFCFLKYRNVTGGYPEFKDIAGAWVSEDYDTCLNNLRLYLGRQAMGLCHLAGNSNYKPKWLMQNLKRLPERDRELGKRILEWFYADCSTEALKRESIIQSVKLIDEIYDHSRFYLESNSKYYGLSSALDLTLKELSEEVFLDGQTKIEFAHRSRMFDSRYPAIASHLETTPKDLLSAIDAIG